MGYAITVAWVLLAIILVFTLLQFRLQRRWVHYS
jgi:multiple sugar transport system permease protein